VPGTVSEAYFAMDRPEILPVPAEVLRKVAERGAS
jgi:hypothetical protein